MNRFRKTFIVMILSIPAIYTACERNITLEPGRVDLLLVNGEFTSDSVVHSIRLSRSGNIVGNSQAITGASVYVTDKADTFHFAECDTAPGLYRTLSKCCGKGGHTYYISIQGIDMDHDGAPESYTASSMMPVPVEPDTLIFNFGKNGSGLMCDGARFKIKYQGPDYIYREFYHNRKNLNSLTEMLGYGEISKDYAYPLPKVQHPDSIKIRSTVYCWNHNGLAAGDTITFLCRNFTREQFKFLKEFDNNTTSNDWFLDNLFDQVRMPVNASTNIEPSDKVAGYFFIYSVSWISGIYKE